MHIPFTAPQIPELDALPAEQRQRVLTCYARSGNARRFVRVLQFSIIASPVLLCYAFTHHGIDGVVSLAVAPLLLVCGVIYYRLAATRTIRAILVNVDFNSTGNETAPLDIHQMRMENWERIQKVGMFRFVVTRGFVFGVSFGLGMSILLPPVEPLYLQLPVYLIGGLVWGLGMWFVTMRQLQRARSLAQKQSRNPPQT